MSGRGTLGWGAPPFAAAMSFGARSHPRGARASKPHPSTGGTPPGEALPLCSGPPRHRPMPRVCGCNFRGRKQRLPPRRGPASGRSYLDSRAHTSIALFSFHGSCVHASPRAHKAWTGRPHFRPCERRPRWGIPSEVSGALARLAERPTCSTAVQCERDWKSRSARGSRVRRAAENARKAN